MSTIQFSSKQFLSAITAVIVAACSHASNEFDTEPGVSRHPIRSVLHVYKRAACGCCEFWGEHMGSPGMGVADKFRPYEVLLLETDGSVETYARINTQQEQY